MTEKIISDPNEFASLPLPTIFDLELAQSLVASGYVVELDQIYQEPKPGEREVYEARRAAIIKRDEELKARHKDDCDCDINMLDIPSNE